MNSLLGILLFLLPVVVALLLLKADKHYRHMHTRGRQDAIQHIDRSGELAGLNQWSYRRGQAVQRELLDDKR